MQLVYICKSVAYSELQFLSFFICCFFYRAEPVYLEFPEFKGNSRRNYWVDICLEILRAHRFIRKYNLQEIQKSEVLAKASLGIFRYHAVREGFQFFSSHYKSLLAFNLAESLPRGDTILETLSFRLGLLNVGATQHDGAGVAYAKRQSPTKQQPTLSPVSLLTLIQLGFILQKEANLDGESVIVGDIYAGEINPLEIAVKQSVLDTGKAEAAQATIDQVKVEGIDTNVAVMKVSCDYIQLGFPQNNSYLCLVIEKYEAKGDIRGRGGGGARKRELIIVKKCLRNKTICSVLYSFPHTALGNSWSWYIYYYFKNWVFFSFHSGGNQGTYSLLFLGKQPD